VCNVTSGFPTPVSLDAVKAYAARFTKENVAVIGSCVSETTLVQLAQNKLSSLPSGSQIDSTKATDINVRTQRYTFSHHNGPLFATQFTQIALVVTEKTAFDDMRSKGLIQRDSAFAGHSLGEYSALASIADVLPISSLVDVVFYRAITVQSAVERDSQNRSN